MYCPAPNPRCSCFAIRTPGGTFFGRNSDFLTDIQDTYSNCFYQPEGDGLSFIGNTTSFIQMEDGVNEYGLSIGLTSVYPAVIKEGLNAGMILRLILQTCRTVPEAVRLAHELPIASSQTFVLTDRSGTIALMELNSCQKEIVIPEGEKAFVCSTNLFHTHRMKSYNDLSLDNWQAEERYQTLFKTLQTRAGRFTREDGFRLLSGAEGFFCQYDRSTGKDTVWSILYDTAARSLYFADGNPSRVPFCADTRLKFIPQP